MVKVLLGSLVTALGLSACGAAQVELPASVDARAENCYRLILQDESPQPPEFQPPVSLEDGTLLVQWRISEERYGSCQIDSQGSVLMLTETRPSAEDAESVPAQSTEATEQNASSPSPVSPPPDSTATP